MLLELLELAGNSAMAHDPESRTRLTRLHGKTMVLYIRPLNQSIAVTPSREGLEFSAQIPDKFDVKLSATVAAMIKISRDGMDDAELQPGELEIVGDPIIGQRFAQVISGLDIEWQALLAEHLGETPAQLITTAASTAKILVDESKLQVNSYLPHRLFIHCSCFEARAPNWSENTRMEGEESLVTKTVALPCFS